MLDPEGEGTVIPRNLGNYLPVDTVQHPRRLETSANKLHNRCSSLCMVNSVWTVWCMWDGVRGDVVINRRRMYCWHWTAISLVGRRCDSTVIEVCINLEEPCVLYKGRAHRYFQHTPFFIFFQQIHVLNFLTCCTLSISFSSKCRLFHYATFFGSCIIHILHTECAKKI
jgi:hypothetical protein